MQQQRRRVGAGTLSPERGPQGAPGLPTSMGTYRRCPGLAWAAGRATCSGGPQHGGCVCAGAALGERRTPRAPCAHVLVSRRSGKWLFWAQTRQSPPRMALPLDWDAPSLLLGLLVPSLCPEPAFSICRAGGGHVVLLIGLWLSRRKKEPCQGRDGWRWDRGDTVPGAPQERSRSGQGERCRGAEGQRGVRCESEAAGSAGTPLRVDGDGDKEGRGLGARWQQWGLSSARGAAPQLPPHPAVTSVPAPVKIRHRVSPRDLAVALQTLWLVWFSCSEFTLFFTFLEGEQNKKKSGFCLEEWDPREVVRAAGLGRAEELESVRLSILQLFPTWPDPDAPGPSPAPHAPVIAIL